MPIIIEDVSKYPQLVDRAVIQEGLRSIVAVPLKSGGEVIGTLIVAGHNLHNFGSEDIQLLSIISEGLGPVLRSAELYYALRKNRRRLTPIRSKPGKRSLYECFHAKVKGNQIYCSKGHALQVSGAELHVRRLERGAPLICGICQQCPDFDQLGPPLPREERGWANL